MRALIGCERIMKMRRVRGFTLIELLVVISIIALLLSILMPGLNKAKEAARTIVSANNIKSLNIADQLYANQNKDWYVPLLSGQRNGPANYLWFQNTEYIGIIGFKDMGNKEKSAGYDALTIPDKFRCPSDRRSVGNGYYKVGDMVLGVSYGMNLIGIYPDASGWYYPTVYGKIYHGWRTMDVKNPQQKYRWMDTTDWGAHRNSANWRDNWDQYHDLCGPPANWHMVAYRHKEGTNVGFFDGHSQYLKKTEVYKLPAKTKPAEIDALNNKSWQPVPGRDYIPRPPMPQ